jgi:hypothetical protein
MNPMLKRDETTFGNTSHYIIHVKIETLEEMLMSLGVRERERSLLNMGPRQTTSSLTELFLA